MVRKASSATVAMSFTATGASLTGVMVNVNTSLPEAVPSLPVTRRVSTPLKFSGGVPLNTPVADEKFSHAGRGELSASVALSVTLGLSTSANMPGGSVNKNGVSSAETRSGIGVTSTGASLTDVTVTLTVPVP